MLPGTFHDPPYALFLDKVENPQCLTQLHKLGTDVLLFFP